MTKQFKSFSVADVPEEGKLPDGVYEFKIRSAKKLLSKNIQGKETAIINLTVLSGKYAGQEITRFADYRNPSSDPKELKRLSNGLKELRGIVSSAGLQGFDDPEDLNGAKFQAKLRNNGDFVNLEGYQPLSGTASQESKPAASTGTGVVGTGRFASRSRQETSSEPLDDDIPL